MSFTIARTSFLLLALVRTLLVGLTGAAAALPANAQLVTGAVVTATPEVGGTPSELTYHLAKLVETQHNYAEHARLLDRIEIAPATEELDTAVARKVAEALEADARRMNAHSRALATVAPDGLARWLEPLEQETRLAWGTAQALGSLFTPETPVGRRHEALEIAPELRERASDLGRLLAGLKQDLGVTTS
jgi:hypothetical protein